MDALVAAGMLPWEAAGRVAPRALGNSLELRSKRVRLTNRYVDEYLPQRLAHKRLITFGARMARELQELLPRAAAVLIPALPRVAFELPGISISKGALERAAELSQAFEATRAAIAHASLQRETDLAAIAAAADAQARRWTEQYKEALAGIKLTPPGFELTTAV
jgi:hypothetical protein